METTNTYKVTFTGRLNGAIGKCYKIVETVQANSNESVILKLYNKYDHIHNPIVKLIKKTKLK